jgi:hypothetical protein
MRVLVACEFSGRVRDAFRKRGHDAVSCDLQESETAGPHLREDVLSVLDRGWDMMIAFPPCTYLSNIGQRWATQPGRAELRQGAIRFVERLLAAPIPRIALENPKGCLPFYIGVATQCVQPYHFGDAYQKETYLWLRGLPKLYATSVVVPPRFEKRPDGKRKNYVNDVLRRPKDRSRTPQGLADAMAAQWG